MAYSGQHPQFTQQSTPGQQYNYGQSLYGSGSAGTVPSFNDLIAPDPTIVNSEGYHYGTGTLSHMDMHPGSSNLRPLLFHMTQLEGRIEGRLQEFRARMDRLERSLEDIRQTTDTTNNRTAIDESLNDKIEARLSSTEQSLVTQIKKIADNFQQLSAAHDVLDRQAGDNVDEIRHCLTILNDIILSSELGRHIMKDDKEVLRSFL